MGGVRRHGRTLTLVFAAESHTTLSPPHPATSEPPCPASARKFFLIFALDGFLFSHHDHFHDATLCRRKVGSRCSKGKLVRAPFLNHCALNSDESRGQITVSLYDDHLTRADAGAHARAAGSRRQLRAPASQHRFTMLMDGWLFTHSARDSVASGLRMIWFQANHSGSP